MGSSPREPVSRKLNNDGSRNSQRRERREPLKETPSRQGGVSRSNFTRSHSGSRDSSRSGSGRASSRGTTRDVARSKRTEGIDGRGTSSRRSVPSRSDSADTLKSHEQRSTYKKASISSECERSGRHRMAEPYEALRTSSRYPAENRISAGYTSTAREASGRMSTRRNGTRSDSSVRNELARTSSRRSGSDRMSSTRETTDCSGFYHNADMRASAGRTSSRNGNVNRDTLHRSESTRNSVRTASSRGAVARDGRGVSSNRTASCSAETRGRHGSSRETSTQSTKNAFLSGLFWNLPLGDVSCASLKRVFVIAVCVVALLTMLFGVDYAMNMNKIYSGVTIGAVDVSGMTKDEATKVVSEHYAPGLANNEILLFADQKAADEYQKGIDVFHEDQYSEEEHSSSRAWRINASALSAELDAASTVERAYQIGREGHRLERFSCIFGGITLNPAVAMDDEKIEEYVERVASASGELREENAVVIEEGIAHAVQGHDGVMPDPDKLKRSFAKAFLNTKSKETDLVPELYDTPVSNSFEAAQTVAETINTALARPVTFTYKDVSFDVPREVIGSWITTELVGKKGAMTLKPLIDVKLGQARLLNYADSHNISVSHSVKFAVKGDDVNVHVNGADEIPQYGKAVEELNTAFFETNGEANQGPVSINITYGSVPTDMSFDQAREKGVISEISTYTTEYTSDVEGRNFNIHHMADFINNSVIPSKGDWSMLGTAGEISKENGYMPGGQIVGDEVVQDYGGGVCQVATTVFNAVYESGFPIPLRYNHSLYMSVYPDGRDAAIAWPELDLVWNNDSPSDVLLKAEYTDTSVTVTLWGVNPGYTVKSETGEWKKTDDFKVKVTYSDEYAKGTDTMERAGQDGKKIVVTRTVLGKDGEVLHKDEFASAYQPVNEKIIRGGKGDTVVLTQESYQKQRAQ